MDLKTYKNKMTRKEPLPVIYNLKDERIYIGVCDEIADISKNDREIILKEACIIPSNMRYNYNRNFIRELYDLLQKEDNIPLKMSEYKSSYILN